MPRVLCPSCGVDAPDGRCPLCGATTDGHTWRPGTMPELKPKREDYIVCPTCTAEGNPVLIHISHIKHVPAKEADFFGESQEAHDECPKGHVLPKSPAPAPAAT